MIYLDEGFHSFFKVTRLVVIANHANHTISDLFISSYLLRVAVARCEAPPSSNRCTRFILHILRNPSRSSPTNPALFPTGDHSVPHIVLRINY